MRGVHIQLLPRMLSVVIQVTVSEDRDKCLNHGMKKKLYKLQSSSFMFIPLAIA